MNRAPAALPLRRTALWAMAALVALAAGCAQPPRVVGLMDVTERPGERALLAGLRAYDDGQYVEAESQFDRALQAGLASPRDRAAAYKHLAFVYCTSERVPACETAFRNALQNDAGFTLSKSEAGHPTWGPVFRRVKGS
jgi:Tfp pilus assembly protein PilF